MKYTLSKKIVYKIIKTEEKEHNTIVDPLPITNLENIYDTIVDEIENKQSDSSITIIETIKNIIASLKDHNFSDLGYYDPVSNKLKIFLTNLIDDTKNKYEYLWALVFITYHEFNHSIIRNENRNNRDILTNFYISIDLLSNKFSKCYNIYHDNFYEEILANNYAIKRSIKFFQKYPNIYKKIKIYMINELLLNKIYSQNYDIHQHLNYFDKKIKHDKDRARLFKSHYPYIIIKTLYHHNGTFKNLQELSQTDSWNNDYTDEMKKLIVSSKAYLTDLDYEKLTQEEIELLLDALNYSYNNEKQRLIQNNKLKQDIERFNLQVETNYKNFNSNEILLPIFLSKEIRNQQKLTYLETQINKLTSLLDTIKLNSKNKSKVLTINKPNKSKITTKEAQDE